MQNIKENIQTDFLDENQGSQNFKEKKIFKTIAQRLLLQFNSKILNKIYYSRCQSREQLIYIRFLFFLNTITYLFIILRFFIMTSKYDCSDSQIQQQDEKCSQNTTSSQIQITVVLTILIVLNILTIIFALKLSPFQLNMYTFIQQFYHCCYLIFKVDYYTNMCQATTQSGLCLNLTLFILVLLNIFAQSYWIFRCALLASLFCSLLINQYQKFQVVDISLSSIVLLISLISIYYHESQKKLDFYKNFSTQKKWQRWLQIFQQRLPFPTIVLTADQDLQDDFKISFVNDQFKSCFNIPLENTYPNDLNKDCDKSSSYINIQQSIQSILQSVFVPINTEQISESFTNQVNAQQGGQTYIQKFKASLFEKIFRKVEATKVVPKSNEAINQKSITSQAYSLKKDSSRKNKKEIHVIQTNQQTPSINEKNPQSIIFSQNMLPLTSKVNQFEKQYLQISLMELIALFMKDCQKRITLFQQISDQQDDLMYTNCIYSPIQKDTQNLQSIQKGCNYEQEEKHFDVHIVDCYEDSQVNIMIVLNDISMKYDNKRLYEMNNYKDKLLATVSHDLKTPLSAMISLVESCIVCIQDDEIKKILQDTLKVSDLLSHLINDIQDYGQIYNCSLKLQLSKFNIKDCLKEILDIFEVKKRKGIDLVLDFEPKVNTGNSDIYQIHSDSQRLKQILLNLIGNAIKFTMKGSIKVFFEVCSDQDNIEITVTDTGIGIPLEIQQKLFKEYKTFDTPSVNQLKFLYSFNFSFFKGLNKNGVGLGLYMSKKLAGLLGPSENIKLVSKEGEGSSFSFVIFKNLHEKLKERAKIDQAQQVIHFSNQNMSENKEQMHLFGEEDISDEQNQQQSSMISDFNQYNFQHLFQKSKFSLTNLSKSPTFIQLSQTDNFQNSQKHFKNQRYFQTSTNNTFVKSNLNTSSEVVKGIKNSPNFNFSEKNNPQDCEQLINLSPQNTTIKNLNQSSSFDYSRLNLNSNLKNMVYSQMKFNNSNNAMNLSSLQFSPQYHSQYKLKTKNILFSNIDRDIENSFVESQNILTVVKTPEQSGLQYLNKENYNFSDNLKDKFVGELEAIQSQHSQSPTIILEKSAIQKQSCINQSYLNNKEDEEELGKQKYLGHRITFECLNPVNNKNNFREQQQSSSSLNTQMLKELKQTNLEVSDMSYIHTNEFSNSVLSQIFAKETHILVVDDEEISHKVFQHQFKQFSTVKIHSAYNGEEAISKILHNQKLISQYNQQKDNNEGGSNSLYQSQNIDSFDQIESTQNKKSQFYQYNFDEEKKNKESYNINLSSLESSINNSINSTEKEYKYIPDEKMNENLNINQIASRKYELNFNNIAQINQVGFDKSYNFCQQTESPINVSQQAQHTLEQEISKGHLNKNNQQKIIKNESKKLLMNQEQCKEKQPLQFSYIFMDYSMPIMDGLQTIQKIRQLQADKLITQQIFIFMVSGYDQKSDTNEFLSNGADGIISKPVSQLKIAQAFNQTHSSM
ncbi:hypothetical protein ABPG74_012261 [Tetrahymena malaccensis]